MAPSQARAVPTRTQIRKAARKQWDTEEFFPPWNAVFPDPNRLRPRLEMAGELEPDFAREIEFRILAKRVLGTGSKGPQSRRLLRKAARVGRTLTPNDPRHEDFRELGRLWMQLMGKAPRCICEDGVSAHDRTISNPRCGFCGAEGSRDDDEPAM